MSKLAIPIGIGRAGGNEESVESLRYEVKNPKSPERDLGVKKSLEL